MTLPEVTYAVLEIIREANIVDDERIDLRLLERFVHSARADFIVKYLDTSKEPIENTVQFFDATMEAVSDGIGTVIRSSTTIPEPLDTKFGLTILEIYPKGDILAIPFSFVEFNRLRFCGKNIFNLNNIFTSYRDGYLYAKSTNDTHRLLEDITVKIIANNPTDIPNYDKETDRYPINESIFKYIKDMILKTDIRLLIAGISDEVNDATGDIRSN